ncbi:hypothetical protein LCGC14_0674820 [marine sediment metagenome]|uniref:HTH cro/C1-type domain-containing protein n=1 Tax=marine sediment metagenome TaxID=412755 RepID=A0A0F9QQ44_9ZZZZ
MEDNLVKLRLLISNARLAAAREKQGLTQVALAAKTGIKYHKLQSISSLRRHPTEKEELNLCAALEELPEYLFPQSLQNAIDEGVFRDRVKQLTQAKVLELTEFNRESLAWDGGVSAIEDTIDNEKIVALLGRSVSSLGPREERVIDLRYGLSTGVSKTMEEVGNEFGVGKARIQYIEAKALRKLRHPSRIRNIKHMIFGEKE